MNQGADMNMRSKQQKRMQCGPDINETDENTQTVA